MKYVWENLNVVNYYDVITYYHDSKVLVNNVIEVRVELTAKLYPLRCNFTQVYAHIYISIWHINYAAIESSGNIILPFFRVWSKRLVETNIEFFFFSILVIH